ncbi:hypothetical protein EDB19DRAFT_1731897, partial [Suillus lakei]
MSALEEEGWICWVVVLEWASSIWAVNYLSNLGESAQRFPTPICEDGREQNPRRQVTGAVRITGEHVREVTPETCPIVITDKWSGGWEKEKEEEIRRGRL